MRTRQADSTRVENTTDATRGQPLGIRARKRKAELEQALAALPADELSARNDINLALYSVDSMLTGDSEQLSDATAAELSRWLERTKHLAETTPASAETTPAILPYPSVAP